MLRFFFSFSTFFYVFLVASTLQEEEPRRGSRGGRRKTFLRDTFRGHTSLMRDYLGDVPVYPEQSFRYALKNPSNNSWDRRRFRVNKSLFSRLQTDICLVDPSLHQLVDAIGKCGATSVQKIAASLHLLAYGVAADSTDPYFRISESTMTVILKSFCQAVVKCYEDQYLKPPTPAQIEKNTMYKQRTWIPWHAWFLRLYALEVEELPKSMGRSSKVL